MQRMALFLMVVSSTLVLGAPQLKAEETQKGRARGRSSGQVTAAPQSTPAGATAAVRRAAAGQTGKAKPAPAATARTPRRSPGIESRAPRAAGPADRTAVRRSRSRPSVSPPRGGVTTVTNGRVTSTRPVRRVVVGKPTAATDNNTPSAARPSKRTVVGRAQVRNTVTETRAPRVTTLDNSDTPSRSQNSQRVIGTGPATSSNTTVGSVRNGRVSRGSQSQAVRRRPGDRNVVGRAIPRPYEPLVASPGYGVSERAAHSSGYRSSYRYGFNSDGPNRIRGRGYYRAPRVSLHHRHVYYPGYVRPRLYGSFFYLPGYSFNLGVSFGSSYRFGSGYGYGYGQYPHGYSGYAHPLFGAYFPYGYVNYTQTPSLADPYTGFLRLKMRPRDAQVYVDGYYVGIVNEFDGVFQRLRLEEGPHRIEVRHPAYLPLELEVLIVTGETVTYQGELYRP